MAATAATAEEIVRFRKNIERSIADSDYTQAERTIEGMQEYFVSIPVLKATKMGVFLAKLAKKGGSDSLKKACLACVKTWQAEIRKRLPATESKVPAAKLAAANSSSGPPTEPSTSSSESATAAASGAGAGGEAKGSASPGVKLPPKAASKSVTVDLSSLPPRRRKLVELLGNSLHKAMKPLLDVSNDTQLRAMCLRRAADLEGVMFETFGGGAPDAGSSGEYSACYRRVQFAVGNNQDLARNVFSRATDFRKLVSLPATELASSDFKQRQAAERKKAADEVNQSWERDNRKEVMKAAGLEQTESMFACSACGSKNTSNYLKQTRSADEPMTTFLTCHDCGHRWRFNA